MDLLEKVTALDDELIALRRKIHENPELSGVEFQTLETIKEYLHQIKVSFIEVEQGGILAFVQNGNSEKTILLRADMDALPLTESAQNLKQDKDTVSKIAGVAHACGHDAHTAMLLIAAKILQEHRHLLDGKVIFCFERAEEGGGPGGAYGAKPILQYLASEKLSVDSCFALHVNPTINAGMISIGSGPVMAGGVGFCVRLVGQGGHGSRPDVANHPVECFMAIYRAITDFRMKMVSPFQPFTFSIPYISSGNLGNVIEKDFVFAGTARFFHPEVGETFEREFLHIVEHTAKLYHCDYDIEALASGGAIINDIACSATAQAAVKTYVGERWLIPQEPLMGSESFRHYIGQYGGAMAFLGIKNDAYGSGADLHDAQFDIDESALKYGAATYAAYALEALSNGK